MINNSSMSKATGYGLRPGFNSWYQHWDSTFRKLYHSASSQKSTKCSLLVSKADRDIKLCSLSVKPNNKYNYLHTAYIAITHHINTTTQWLTLLPHILMYLVHILAWRLADWIFCACLSLPDKCQDSSLIETVTTSTCYPIHDSLLILSLDAT